MFYTGSSEDGSDMRRTGMYLSPDGQEWGSSPYTKDQKEHARQEGIFRDIISYLRQKYGENKDFDLKLEEEYSLVLNKKSNLSRTQREFLKNMFNEK